jgi:hypothetical protein
MSTPTIDQDQGGHFVSDGRGGATRVPGEHHEREVQGRYVSDGRGGTTWLPKTESESSQRFSSNVWQLGEH